MSVLSFISVLTLYSLSLLGDGCIVVAIALAASVGGRPWLWGVSFAGFHALYAFIGIVVTAELALYSERLGDILVLIGSVVLLRHFLHHRIHHVAQRDCSCENHQHTEMSSRAIISTAAALSLHSLAAGAIVREIVGPVSNLALISLLLTSSLLVGSLISIIVLLGDTERIPILRTLDKVPGAVATILTGVCCFALYHTFEEIFTLSTLATAAFIVASLLVAIFVGYLTHGRESEDVVQISSRKFN